MKWFALTTALTLALICGIFSLNAGFISNDLVLIEAASSTSLAKTFTTNWLGSKDDGGFYRPIAVISFKIDKAMHDLDPKGYHWTNLWLHLLVTLCAFLLIYRLQNNSIIAFIAASLFAVHPVHTEAISLISGRSDLLCSFFYLISLNLFLAMDPRESKGCLTGILALIAGALAMLTNEMAYTLPIMIIVVDRLDRPRDVWWRSYRTQHYASYFVLLAGILIMRFLSIGQLWGTHGPGIYFQPARIFAHLSTYIDLLIQPFAIITANNLLIHKVVTLSAVILSVVGLFSDRTRLSVTFWWIAILPVLTVSRAQFLYLPSLGVFWILSILLVNTTEKDRSIPGEVSRSILVFILILSSLLQTNKSHLNQIDSDRIARGIQQISDTDLNTGSLLESEGLDIKNVTE